MVKTAMDTRRLKELVDGWCYKVRHREHGECDRIKSVNDTWRKFFQVVRDYEWTRPERYCLRESRIVW